MQSYVDGLFFLFDTLFIEQTNIVPLIPINVFLGV